MKYTCKTCGEVYPYQLVICNDCGVEFSLESFNVEKTTREEAMEWWNNHSNDWRRRTDEKFGFGKRFHQSLTGREIEEIWKQETKQPQPDIFNLNNKAMFSVNDLKEFSEKFAFKCTERGNKDDLTGFWDLCKEMFYDRFIHNK